MSLLEKLKAVLAGGSNRESGSGNATSGAASATTANTSSERAVKESVDNTPSSTTSEPSVDDERSVEPADETPATSEGIGDTAENGQAGDEAVEVAAETDSSDAAGSASPVSEISGIGPAYSDRLESIGVETVEQLADADPDAIAEQTDISIGRVSNWIERARNV